MAQQEVRVRFAPSPTGGLHLGGIRTVLFNYLFAKKNNGTFILRIEDTDQSRFVPGAEDYIFDCLDWCGLKADESVRQGGAYGPYRQSERKAIYQQYAEQLVRDGYAYYAFDTAEELESMRQRLKTDQSPSPQYDRSTRSQMRNSLTLSAEETQELLASGVPYVIRIKIPEHETVSFSDMIRGTISYDTNVVDDKVLLKSDGMPTYHLAVVVDDYLMKITHAFRGEEWLPSAPVHLLLWKYLGWEESMPTWAHLPLILKPDGHGKLSKRDGERLGFPVYAMDWTDPNTGITTPGFKETGFLPEAFINILAVLGWNDGTEEEIYTLERLGEVFSMDRVHKGGAKFDYEKAKWYNQQWIARSDNKYLAVLVAPYLEQAGINNIPEAKLMKAIELVKERCQLLTDFVVQASYFFSDPSNLDLESIRGKWTEDKANFFRKWSAQLQEGAQDAAGMEAEFLEAAKNYQIKKGEVMLPLRIMLVGGKFGPSVFDIAEFIGAEAVQRRIAVALEQL